MGVGSIGLYMLQDSLLLRGLLPSSANYSGCESEIQVASRLVETPWRKRCSPPHQFLTKRSLACSTLREMYASRQERQKTTTPYPPSKCCAASGSSAASCRPGRLQQGDRGQQKAHTAQLHGKKRRPQAQSLLAGSTFLQQASPPPV